MAAQASVIRFNQRLSQTTLDNLSEQRQQLNSQLGQLAGQTGGVLQEVGANSTFQTALAAMESGQRGISQFIGNHADYHDRMMALQNVRLGVANPSREILLAASPQINQNPAPVNQTPAAVQTTPASQNAQNPNALAAVQAAVLSQASPEVAVQVEFAITAAQFQTALSEASEVFNTKPKKIKNKKLRKEFEKYAKWYKKEVKVLKRLWEQYERTGQLSQELIDRFGSFLKKTSEWMQKLGKKLAAKNQALGAKMLQWGNWFAIFYDVYSRTAATGAMNPDILGGALGSAVQFTGQLNNWWPKFIKKPRGFFGGLFGFVGDVFKGITGFVGKIMNGITGFVSKIAKGAIGIFSKVISFVPIIGKPISQGLNWVKKNFDGILSIATTVLPLFGLPTPGAWLTGKLLPWLGKAVPFLGKAADWVQKGITTVKGWAAGVTSWFKGLPVVSNIFKAVEFGKKILNTADQVAGYVGFVLPGVKKFITNATGWVRNTVGGFVPQFIKDGLTAAKSVGGLLDRVYTIAGYINPFKPAVTTTPPSATKPAIVAQPSGLQQWIQKNVPWLGDAARWVNNAITDVKEFVSKIIPQPIKDVYKFLKETGPGILGQIDTIAASIAKVFPDVGKFLTNATKWIRDGVSKAIPGFVKDAVKIFEQISGILNQVQGYASQLATPKPTILDTPVNIKTDIAAYLDRMYAPGMDALYSGAVAYLGQDGAVASLEISLSMQEQAAQVNAERNSVLIMQALRLDGLPGNDYETLRKWFRELASRTPNLPSMIQSAISAGVGTKTYNVVADMLKNNPAALQALQRAAIEAAKSNAQQAQVIREFPGKLSEAARNGSLWATGAGVVSAFIPGLEEFAPGFFTLAGYLGAASGGANIVDRIQQGTFKWDLETALDTLAVAGGVGAGAASAARYLQMTRLSNGLVAISVASNNAQLLVLPAYYVDEIRKVNESNLPQAEKDARIKALLQSAAMNMALISATHFANLRSQQVQAQKIQVAEQKAAVAANGRPSYIEYNPRTGQYEPRFIEVEPNGRVNLASQPNIAAQLSGFTNNVAVANKTANTLNARLSRVSLETNPGEFLQIRREMLENAKAIKNDAIAVRDWAQRNNNKTWEKSAQEWVNWATTEVNSATKDIGRATLKEAYRLLEVELSQKNPDINKLESLRRTVNNAAAESKNFGGAYELEADNIKKRADALYIRAEINTQVTKSNAAFDKIQAELAQPNPSPDAIKTAAREMNDAAYVLKNRSSTEANNYGLAIETEASWFSMLAESYKSNPDAAAVGRWAKRINDNVATLGSSGEHKFDNYKAQADSLALQVTLRVSGNEINAALTSIEQARSGGSPNYTQVRQQADRLNNIAAELSSIKSVAARQLSLQAETYSAFYKLLAESTKPDPNLNSMLGWKNNINNNVAELKNLSDYKTVADQLYNETKAKIVQQPIDNTGNVPNIQAALQNSSNAQNGLLALPPMAEPRIAQTKITITPDMLTDPRGRPQALWTGPGSMEAAHKEGYGTLEDTRLGKQLTAMGSQATLEDWTAASRLYAIQVGQNQTNVPVFVNGRPSGGNVINSTPNPQGGIRPGSVVRTVEIPSMGGNVKLEFQIRYPEVENTAPQSNTAPTTNTALNTAQSQVNAALNTIKQAGPNPNAAMVRQQADALSTVASNLSNSTDPAAIKLAQQADVYASYYKMLAETAKAQPDLNSLEVWRKHIDAQTKQLGSLSEYQVVADQLYKQSREKVFTANPATSQRDSDIVMAARKAGNNPGRPVRTTTDTYTIPPALQSTMPQRSSFPAGSAGDGAYSTAVGDWAENVGNQYLQTQAGWNNLGSHGTKRQGLDGLYTDSSPTDYKVVEMKYNTATLQNTVNGKQLSESWTLSKNRLMEALGGDNVAAFDEAVNILRSGYTPVQVEISTPTTTGTVTITIKEYNKPPTIAFPGL